MRKKGMRPNKRAKKSGSTRDYVRRRALADERDARPSIPDRRSTSGWPVLQPGAV